MGFGGGGGGGAHWAVTGRAVEWREIQVVELPLVERLPATTPPFIFFRQLPTSGGSSVGVGRELSGARRQEAGLDLFKNITPYILATYRE